MEDGSSEHRWRKFITGSAGRLGTGLIVGAITVAVVPGRWGWTLRPLAGWSAGAGIYLAVAWWVMMRSNPAETHKRCRRDDAYRGAIDTLLLFASVASVGAVCLALRESSGGDGPDKIFSVGIPILGAMLAWLLVHTLFAMHYARLFYQNDEDPDGPPAGGIDMHLTGDEQPDYRDFLYIAIAVACTFGVTDTELTSKVLRRTVTHHALLSFAFATIVLALAVNVLTNLLSKGG